MIIFSRLLYDRVCTKNKDKGIPAEKYKEFWKVILQAQRTAISICVVG